MDMGIFVRIYDLKLVLVELVDCNHRYGYMFLAYKSCMWLCHTLIHVECEITVCKDRHGHMYLIHVLLYGSAI